jgi:hydrogenase/urease accessory protein HupE
MTATVRAHLPPTSTTFSLRLPEVLGTVVLTVERPSDEPAATASDPGRWSDPIPIHLSPTIASTQPTSESSRGGVGGTAVPPTSASIPFLKTLTEFLRLGFTHIIPEGLDHILFVLGLFLLSTRLKPLLAQVTAFTLAHSLTLGLSLYGVIHLPSSVVEPLIALSIAFIAIENLFTNKLNPWRPFVVFAFGLVHGLGFAGILHDLSLPRSQFLPALLGFNLGVETGQLSVIAAAFLAVGWFRSQNWYRPAIAIPASLLIAATGLFWTVQRIVSP